MTTFDAAKAIFAQVDTNHDGRYKIKLENRVKKNITCINVLLFLASMKMNFVIGC